MVELLIRHYLKVTLTLYKRHLVHHQNQFPYSSNLRHLLMPFLMYETQPKNYPNFLVISIELIPSPDSLLHVSAVVLVVSCALQMS
jgi:hypothetical protein